MGALAALRPGIGRAELAAAAALIDVGPLPIASPWASPHGLASIVVADLFPGYEPSMLSRADAIRVPAVARARGIVCTTIARIELGAYRGDARLTGADEPAWIASTDGAMSPFHRMLWTVDDLLFYGWSCWRVTRRAADSDGGRPLRFERIPMGQWEIEPNTNRVLIYRPDARGGVTLQPANSREVVLIPGPHEGLLVEGAPAVRHARDLQTSAHNAGRFPSAYLGLKQTTGTPLKRRSDDAEEVTVETILADWRNARLNPHGGGVAWLGGVEPVELGTFADHLVTDGRNAADVDVARHAYIPADLIDATVPESSLHYSTSRDNDRRAIDYGLGAYMSAISGRLTQDDVTAHGQRVAFDLERWLHGAAPLPGQLPASPAPGMTPGPGPGDPTAGPAPVPEGQEMPA